MVTELGLTVSVDVRGRRSIADLLPKSRNRCGVYLLEFADGLFYIGQARDVVRRFSQHRKLHDDIVRWGFRAVKRRNLDAVERELIHRAPSLGLTLTNKVHVSHIVGETDLDELLAQMNNNRGTPTRPKPLPKTSDSTSTLAALTALGTSAS